MGKKPAAAVLVLIALGAVGAVGVPSASGDDCPEGWVCGVTAPPVPPDQAGNPQPVTIEADQNPDVPPSVGVDLGLPQPPHRKACHAKKHKHDASAAKKGCRKKRH
jgi:hypothetical protein